MSQQSFTFQPKPPTATRVHTAEFRTRGGYYLIEWREDLEADGLAVWCHVVTDTDGRIKLEQLDEHPSQASAEAAALAR